MMRQLYRLVPFMKQTQADKGEIWFMKLDGLADAKDQRR
jgi:hypothetical protein